jgi:peptidoglycan/xylan/chitin deacetylase (PgdA/CDA1 family)
MSAAVPAPAGRGRSIWLMYHDVYAGAPAAGVPLSASIYHVSRDLFRRHLEVVAASGLPVLTARESLEGTGAAAGDHVVITFDDGWAGSLGPGLECLVEAGYPGTFFVTRDYVGRPGFGDGAALLEAQRAGMEIGSHGCTHRLLGELEAAEVRRELCDSRAFLEDILGGPVGTASVPGGSWSPVVGGLARASGYVGLATSRPGINHPGVTQFTVTGPRLRSGLLDVPRRLLGPRRYAAIRRRLLGDADDERAA